MHQNQFSLGSLQRSPDPRAGIKGTSSKESEGMQKGEGDGREGRQKREGMHGRREKDD